MMAAQMRIIDEMLDGFDDEGIVLEDDDYAEFDFSDFDEDFTAQDESTVEQSTTPALTNATFQRLFRATAGKLHPDREPDPELRRQKQVLMANLLKARKRGDVMTILSMYEEYVGDHEGFSKADEKQLVATLENLIGELESEKEQIIDQSPRHATAFHHFYNRSRKKVDQAFAEQLAGIKKERRKIVKMVAQIRSLATLKPWLEQRYDVQAEPSLDEILRILADSDSFEDFRRQGF